MVVHYMSMPLIVTVIGAVAGNVLGYTVFKDLAVSLYYNSYSLPACHAVWSNTAIVKTTVIPLILMFCINLFVIVRKLQFSPLRFLRHDLSVKRRAKAMRLPKWSFLKRFRLRILFQNMPNSLCREVHIRNNDDFFSILLSNIHQFYSAFSRSTESQLQFQFQTF
jgi:putative ABC transport system permease protein